MDANNATVVGVGGTILGTSTGGVLTSVKETPNRPREFYLQQNYPNPFNPSTNISYQLPMQSHVMLKVFDVLGREVARLVSAIQGPGYKEANWNASSFASGIYFYRLEATSVANPGKTFTQVRKMVLMR